MPSSLHEIHINADPHKVFDAWTTQQGLSSWWTKDSRVPAEAGKTYVFVFDSGNVEFHFRVDQQKKDRYVRWTGVEAKRMPGEWVGTNIEVFLESTDQGTKMRFQHTNWKTDQGMYCICNTTWGELMYRLKDYCEGRGRGPLFTG